MYFNGRGVPVDRPLGAAWMVLAAERGNKRYASARDMMVTLLSEPEFARTDELWSQLIPTYGDKVALRRAKAQWAWVRTHQTGTRVGGATAGLRVSGPGASAGGVAGGIQLSGTVDGSIAYRQFLQSDNPYDPIFRSLPTGTVVVKPVQSISDD